ncbi:MAG: ubiquitin-like domain-containing protein [Kordiimonas sp.]
MKKLLLSTAFAIVVLAPSSFAVDRVTITMGDMKQNMRIDDLKEMSVCTFKKQVANTLGLELRKFDLREAGMKLKDDKTMYGSGVRPHNKIEVKPVTSSFQCR